MANDNSTDRSDPTAAPATATGHGAFGRAYWMLNSIEMFERLAYFGIRSVVPIYIMQATEPGGLHLTAAHKGWIYAWWAIFQSFLPMVTGGFADRYGYKRVLGFAISMNVVGYIMMAFMPSYYGFFAGIIVLATGTAFFKPALQGSIAQNLTKKNSSLGWGLFYWVVNVGAVCAPFLATVILGKPHSAEGWRNLFVASAVYTSMNLLLLLTFTDVPSGADKSLSLMRVLSRTFENIWPYWFRGGRFSWDRGLAGIMLGVAGLGILIMPPREALGALQPVAGCALLAGGVWFLLWLRGGSFVWQLRLPAFLLIMSCFWMMMYQLWDLHPNFIEDWVDSSMIAAHLPFDAWKEYGDRGIIRVPQQILLNLNALLIVLLVVPVSWLVRKMRTLSAMLIGMSVATTGVLVAGLTGNGWILLLGIVFFSLGEMLTGPKKNEYLGLIAPKGKKGLYLGYVNIPIGIGVGIGSWIAGHSYGTFGEKASLALNHLAANTQLVARAARSADWSDSLQLLPELLKIERGTALERAAADLGQDVDGAAATLREMYRHDQGQIINLGFVYLALSPEFRKKTSVRLARILKADEEDARAHAIGERLAADEVVIDEIGPARFVHFLPEALGIRRPALMEVLRDRVNRSLQPEERMDNAAIVEMLWSRFGEDRETLNNLALEYLAQGTDRLEAAVAGMRFADPSKDIKKRLGIGRTKSFAALSAAMGAPDDELDGELARLGGAQPSLDNRVFVYLVNQPHHRFLAVARRDWTRDTAFLRAMIESDQAAGAVVAAGIHNDPWRTRLWNRITSPFASREEVSEGGIDYMKLAGRQELIQKALGAKDWSGAGEQAGQLLGMNQFEARALAAAEVNGAPVRTTRLLWDSYSPQLYVWLPFAAIGIAATIALGIFGRMARRWADMNA